MCIVCGFAIRRYPDFQNQFSSSAVLLLIVSLYSPTNYLDP